MPTLDYGNYANQNETLIKCKSSVGPEAIYEFIEIIKQSDLFSRDDLRFGFHLLPFSIHLLKNFLSFPLD